MKKTDKLDIQKEKKFDAINKYIIFLEYSKKRVVQRNISFYQCHAYPNLNS